MKKFSDYVLEDGNKVVNEQNYSQDEVAMAMNHSIDELQNSIKRIKNPEEWSEKYHKTANEIIKLIDRLVTVFDKMR